MTWANFSIARRIAACCAACWLCSACATGGAAGGAPAVRDATAALIAHREFEAAARAAPLWVSEVLSTITRLEAETATRRP